MSRKSKYCDKRKTCSVHTVEIGYIRSRLTRIEVVLWSIVALIIGKQFIS